MNRAAFAPGEFYHLYNRGTEKRKIFLDDTDYQRFLSLLYLANGTRAFHVHDLRLPRGETSGILEIDRGETLVDLAAYCLMPNHFHLLVREKQEGGISRFMQKLSTGYTMYFNKRYERDGSLFQGVFKSQHASKNEYLKYLISYIHLNPVKLIESKWRETGIQDRRRVGRYLQEYAYSSFLDYCGEKRAVASLINFTALPTYFETPKNFKENVTEWLNGASSPRFHLGD